MGKHIITNGFVENYTRWICHGEAHRAREEVVRQRIDDYDADASCADMLADFHEAHFEEGPREEPPEPTAKQYYDMLSAAADVADARSITLSRQPQQRRVQG